MSWRRILLLSVCLVAVLGGVTWGLLQRSDVATQIVQRELQALFRTPASVRTTSLDLGLGRLGVAGLRLDDPTRPGEALVQVEQVAVDVAVASGGGFVAVHAVRVDGFELTAGPRLPRADELLATPPAASSGGPLRLPPLELRRGRVRYTALAGEPALELHDLAVSVAPKPDLPWLVVRATATVPELGAQLELRGDVDPASGAADVTAVLRGGRLDERTIARVCRLLGTNPPALQASATLRSLRIHAVLPAAGRDTPPRFEVGGELADVAVHGPELPTIVTAATVELEGHDRDGGTATLRLRQTTPNGDLDVVARATALRGEPQVEVRVHGKDIRIDAEIVKALKLFDTGRDVVAALQPTAGQADLELFLQNPQRRGGLAELDLALRGVAMSFHGFGREGERTGFPLPMRDTRGRVQLRDDVLVLADVHAAIAGEAGGGTVRMHGRVDTKQRGGDDAALDIHATGVAFCADLRTALSALLHDGGALYDKFAPEGRTDVDVLVRPRRELPGGWSVTVRPEAAAMQWAGFPYRLDDLRGSVVAQELGVRFDLAGRHGPGRLAMRGFIPLGPADAETPGFVADVDVGELACDDELRQAVAVLAPGLDAHWRRAAPRGRLSGQVKVWRPRPDDPLYHDARIDLADVDLALPAAPWRATGLQGRILVQGLGDATRVDFDALRGQLDHGTGRAARLAMLGNVVAGANPGEELTFVVRDLELDAQLGRTLEELDALDLGTWEALAPSGRVDLVCRHRRSGATTTPLHVVVNMLDVRSDAAILLRPAEHMTGELVIADDELRFDDVRAVLGGAQVTATAGRVARRPAPDLRTDIAFTVDARGVPVDDGIANLFSGPLRNAVLQRQLLGRADVDALRLSFALPGRGNTLPFETTLAGQLRLYDLDMTLGTGLDGIVVQGINGVVTLADSTVSDTGGGLRGALRGVSLTLFGQPFEAIDASFLADAERLAVAALTARVHGGTLRSGRSEVPGIEYLLPGPTAPDGRLRADLAFANVDVYTFLEHGGWQNPPYTGAAGGTLVLDRLDGSNVLSAEGRGTIRLERADLGVVPLFTAIYAQLPAADRPRFTGLDVTWQVRDRAMVFETFDVHSNLLAARGKGQLGFDGYLAVELTLDKLLGNSADPFVMPLIEYLTQNIVSFQLHGYLRDLHADKRWFNAGPPARRGVLPMPPAGPRPVAPPF